MTTYSPYIFRMPEDTPDLDFGSLQRLLWPATAEHKIGTTVTITGTGLDSDEPGIAFRLYDTVIAVIRRDSVEFPVTGDVHMATSEWIARIVRDNAIGRGAGRIRRRQADPLVPGPRGYAGPLAIDYDRDRLVEGHTYPVGDIEGMRRKNAEWKARWDAERRARREADAVKARLDWARWEAERLRLAIAGDERATMELDEMGMSRTGQDAVTRLAELDAELNQAKAAALTRMAERAYAQAGSDPDYALVGLAAELRARELTGPGPDGAQGERVTP
jgi:hypothetical protein